MSTRTHADQEVILTNFRQQQCFANALQCHGLCTLPVLFFPENFSEYLQLVIDVRSHVLQNGNTRYNFFNRQLHMRLKRGSDP